MSKAPAIKPCSREIAPGKGKSWRQALAAWDNRLAMPSALQAVDLFKQIAAQEKTADSHAWCARAHFFVGDYQDTSKERARWHEAGYRLGRDGIGFDAKHVGACFWTAACLGSYIETLSMLRAALYVPETVRYLKHVYAADMEYYHGGLARYLGQSLVRQPVLTEKFLGLAMPDVTPDVLLDGLRRAVNEAPPFVLNLQTLGEVAFRVHTDRKTVREMLDRMAHLDLDAEPNLAPENHLDLPRATRRLTALL